jgi:ApaG protein
MNEEHNQELETEHPSRILIEVETSYMDDQSKPEANRFVYAYTITITNQTQENAQLISRHWVIRDANDKIQEVTGLGVIGEQPHIEPDKSYSYTSGVVLETEFGTMEGSYQMRKSSGDLFDAPIPTFALVPPHAIH